MYTFPLAYCVKVEFEGYLGEVRARSVAKEINLKTCVLLTTDFFSASNYVDLAKKVEKRNSLQ